MPIKTGASEYAKISFAQNKQLTTPYTVKSSEPKKFAAISQVLRLLSHNECQLIFSVADNQGKVMLGLIVSGVCIDELLVVKKE